MKSILRILLAYAIGILVFIALVVGGYFIYVSSNYYRLDDNISSDITHLENRGIFEKLIKSKEKKQYSVTSWNIGFGAYTDDYSFFMDGGKYSRALSPERLQSNMGEIISQLSDFNSDFYFLQEVDIDSTRTFHMNQLNAITDSMNSDKRFSWSFAMNYDSPYLFYPFSEPHGKSKSGMVTMSKYDITSSIRRSLPVQKGFAKYYDLDRCYNVSRVAADNGKDLVLINVHLSAYTTDKTIAKKQLDVLNEDLRKEYAKGNYVICGGDFNKDLLGNSSEVFGVSGEDYSWAQPIPKEDIAENYTLIAPLDPEKPVSSCRNADSPWNPMTNFQVTVDGFLISDNVKLISSAVVDQKFKFSDHHPVQMVVSFE